jgi:putative membrane protein
MNWKQVLPIALMAPALALAQPKPTDPQIAGIVVTANQIDIDAGKIAKARSGSKAVKDFAQQMITDHTAVNQQAGALAKKLGVKPEDSETTAALKKGAAENVASLKKLKGAAFDKAYVAHEAAYHQQVLDAIDKVLIPGAQNAELKDLITKVRPAIQAHLDHAKHLEASLAKK